MLSRSLLPALPLAAALLVAAPASGAAAAMGGPVAPRTAQQPALGLDGTRAAAQTDPVTEWQLGDALAGRLRTKWIERRGAYGGAGNISIRQNAMLLELHALAAADGHTGPARQDAHADALVRFFTAPPVLVWKTNRRRETGIFPHTPAFEAVYTRNSTAAALHPSADAIVIRALMAAWEARDQLGLSTEARSAIRRAVGAVALGWFYRRGYRADNQINWNADVLMADAVVNGRASSLRRYRDQLIWFARHMNTPIQKGGSSNVTAGGAFRYSPRQPPNSGANQWMTAEYANLVHSAFGHYGRALSLGMRPIPAASRSRLQRWSKQIAFGTWTNAGYLNWDTGLSTKRRHLRQYWGLALDGLVRGAQPGAIVGDREQRAWILHVAKAGVDLFARTAWDGVGPLPGPTSFGAPNGFPAATDNEYMAPLRFATVAVLMRRTLSDVQSISPGLLVSHDQQTGRLAFSTPIYNGAILRRGPGPEGGLEPTRLFDGRQRPLTLLGADAFAGASPGVRLLAGGRVAAETQPGHSAGHRAIFVSVPGQRRNRTARYSTFKATGTTGSGKRRITVLHLLSRGELRTRYVLRGTSGARVVARMPVWGASSEVELTAGARRGTSGRWIRTEGPLVMTARTAAGAQFTVTFTGIPRSARLSLQRRSPTPRAPAGIRQLVISASAGGVREISRVIAVAPSVGVQDAR